MSVTRDILHPNLHGKPSPSIDAVRLTISADGAAGLSEFLERAGSAGPRLLSWAVNRVARRARSTVVKGLAAKINLTQKELKRRNVFLHLGSERAPTADIAIRGRQIPAIRFAPVPKTPSPKRQRRLAGSSAVIFRDIGRQTFLHAFTAKMPSGHVGIFQRIPGTHTNWDLFKEQIRELKPTTVVYAFLQAAQLAPGTLDAAMAEDLLNEVAGLWSRLKAAGGRFPNANSDAVRMEDVA